MSICVALNLSDGVVMAVDSAITMFSGTGTISKVFLDADKLFQLGKLKVGIATYGVASLHGRTIGSFVREFAGDKANADLPDLDLKEIVERLRKFIFAYYRSFGEQVYGKPFDEIDDNLKGILGLVIGGFSPGSFQSEIWEIMIPTNKTEHSAVQRNAPGAYGINWFASSIPINRYIKGIDPALSVKLKTEFEKMLGREITADEQKRFGEILGEHEYRISSEGMPIQIGIECAKFLVNFVIGHYTFSETHPIVGGKTKVGVVSYSHDAFTLLG